MKLFCPDLGKILMCFVLKDLLYTDDDEVTELADPAEKLEELLSR